MLSNGVMAALDGVRALAVYGTGVFAKRFLRAHEALPVIAVYDRDQTEGTFCSVPVRPLETAGEDGVEVIVVASVMRHERLIYQRIAPFCRRHGICVIDIYGHDLAEAAGQVYGGLGQPVSLQEAEQLVDAHEVISFDIFDTLWMRRTLQPVDVFAIVGSRMDGGRDGRLYRRARAIGELKSIRDACHTLPSIYRYVQDLMDWDDATRDAYLAMELAVERDVFFARPGVKELFAYAAEKGKRIFLVSDMYLPADFLSKVLASAGVTGFEEILVSGYVGRSKEKGLFDDLHARIGTASCLHIGDNPEADGEAAILSGMDSLLVPKAAERMYAAHPELAYAAETVNDRSLLAMMAEMRFADPFAALSDVPLSFDRYAAQAVAPLLLRLVTYLARRAEAEKPAAILFLARDGYLMKKVYDWMAEEGIFRFPLPPSKYVYMSRRAAVRLSMTDEARIGWTRREGVLENAFGEEEDEDIIDEAVKERAGFLRYLVRQGIDAGQKSFVVDLIFSGMQFSCLQPVFPCSILTGLSENMSSRCPLHAEGAIEGRWSLSQVVRLETIFTSSEGTVRSFGEDGRPVFGRAKDGAERVWLERMQEAVASSCHTFLKRLYVPEEEISPQLCSMMFCRREAYGITQTEEAELFAPVHIIDDLDGGDRKADLLR